MNRLKALLFCGIAAIALNSQAQDQPRQAPDPAKKAEKVTQQMQTELNLTEDQVARVSALNLEFATDMHSLRQEGEADRETRKEKAKAMKDAHRAQLAEVLTEDQLLKWDAIVKEKKQEMKDRRKRKQD